MKHPDDVQYNFNRMAQHIGMIFRYVCFFAALSIDVVYCLCSAGVEPMKILDENGNIGISNVNPHATKYQMPGELLKRLRDFFEVQHSDSGLFRQ